MNDIDMIRFARHSIAMGNATEKIKEEAEFVTTDLDKDGIYNGLKHYGLI
jgi:hydroxymethylpyrimidine pyrophosphatase-like HAD family hydrolase